MVGNQFNTWRLSAFVWTDSSSIDSSESAFHTLRLLARQNWPSRKANTDYQGPNGECNTGEWSNYMYGPYGLYGPYGPYGPLRALRALYGPFTGPIRALRDLRASNSPETDFTWILPGFFGTKTSPYMLKSFLFSSRYTGFTNPPSAKVENFMWTISGPLRHFTVPNQKKFR